MVAEIEHDVEQLPPPVHSPRPRTEGSITIRPGTRIGFATIATTLLRTYPKRTVLCLALGDVAGVSLQRGRVQLRPDPSALLPGGARPRGSLPAAICPDQLPRSAVARSPVRRGWAASR